MQNDKVDEATRRLEAERAAEMSPAQPADAHRIDADDLTDADVGAAPAHVKHERGPHMEH